MKEAQNRQTPQSLALSRDVRGRKETSDCSHTCRVKADDEKDTGQYCKARARKYQTEKKTAKTRKRDKVAGAMDSDEPRSPVAAPRPGKLAEGRQSLLEIYGWFTEGFDTKDVQEAKALLKELP